MSESQPFRGFMPAAEPQSWDVLKLFIDEGLEELAATGCHVHAVESIRFGMHDLPGIPVVQRGYLVEGTGVETPVSEVQS